MATDYHRGPTESIPIGDQLPPESHGAAAQHPGAQLPHADLVHLERQLNPDSRAYPSLLERDHWATEQILSLKLNVAEGAVLRRICHYAGTPQGCWAGIDRIALEIGSHEKTVRRAITTLKEHNAVLQGPWKDRVRTLLLNFDSTATTETPPNDSGLSARYQLTDTGLSARSDQNDIGLSARSELPQQSGDSGHRARSEPDHIGLSARSQPNDSGHSVPDSGQKVHLTGKNKKEEREDINNLSLSSRSYSGSPGRESDVPDEPDPSPVTQSGVSEAKPTNSADHISALVVENWPLLARGKWKFLQAAINHYERFGMEYLQRDLRVKRAAVEEEERATRTCAHCNTVHDNSDQLTPCAMCNQPKCVSYLSPCHRVGCQGSPSARNRGSPSSRQRR